MAESSEDPTTPDVIVDDAHRRLELVRGDERAELRYRVDGNQLVMEHTEVPESWGGQGVGGRLVLAAATKAAREGRELESECPFATKWMEKHPDELRDAGDVGA
ncbi:MAG: GNAT family N-acetyltransferase [Acidimicrobiales bacterium]